MIWIVLGLVIMIAGLAILHSRVKAWNAAVTFPEFLESVSIAADEAESAYVAQVNMLSGNRNEASPKGIALARFLAAGFPSAAAGGLSVSNKLHNRFAASAPVRGTEFLQLASGLAIKGMKLSQQDSDTVKEDANVAAKTYVKFFNNFVEDPVSNMQRGIIELAPLWERASEHSLGKGKFETQTTQYVTSGLALFLEWVRVLAKR